MSLISNSQIISSLESNIVSPDSLPKTFLPNVEVTFMDTSVCFTYPQARIMFVDLINGGISDSMVVNLENQVIKGDSINNAQKMVIENLEEENKKQVKINDNLNVIIANKDSVITNNKIESDTKDQKIEVYKDEIKKQKLLKWSGFAVATLEAVFFIWLMAQP